MAEAKRKTESKRKAPSRAKATGKPKAASKVKPKAKPRAKRAAKRKLVPLPSLEEALEWRGLRVDDSGGGSLGKISGIHVDAESNDPKWVIAKIGMFSGEAAIPFEHVAEAGGRLWAAYDRDAVRNSPKLKANQVLSSRQELQLCEHYGIRPKIGRAAELADRDGDDVSAVPADGG
ncbi:MAG: PRC-barrel domain-containing protein [Solirubrobacterales bacterium]